MDKHAAHTMLNDKQKKKGTKRRAQKHDRVLVSENHNTQLHTMKSKIYLSVHGIHHSFSPGKRLNTLLEKKTAPVLEAPVGLHHFHLSYRIITNELTQDKHYRAHTAE